MISRWRVHYWSCSRFADWVRGTPKPPGGTAEEWDAWDQQAKAAHPIRFWLTEEGLNKIQDTLNFPADVWRTVRTYLLNRFVYEYHLLRADREFIRPGDYRDFGDRILPCLFSSFARWVERDIGLEHFEWEKDLVTDDSYGVDETHPEWGKLTRQALKAREVILLHWWWRSVRPNRVPADAKSMEFYLLMTEKYDKEGRLWGLTRHFTPEELTTFRELHAEEDRIEQEYYDEDTAMLNRLIALRRELWH